MILLADGGSTKVDWCLIDHGKLIKRVYTKGANPFFRTKEDISEEIKNSLMPEIKGFSIDIVRFYGAGCAFPEKNEIIKAAIADNISTNDIIVGSDLLGAAKGLCGRNKGIACIIGTGSNSCFYDGEEIKQNVSPLGYILGDEGSGAVLGRLFVGACLKDQLTPGIKEDFFKYIGLTQGDILDKVYKQPMANRFLASISPFIKQNVEDETVYYLVYNSFKDFFLKNVMQYDYKNNKVHITGSVAYYYADILKKIGKDLGIEIGAISKSPMDGLIKFYSELEQSIKIN